MAAEVTARVRSNPLDARRAALVLQEVYLREHPKRVVFDPDDLICEGVPQEIAGPMADLLNWEDEWIRKGPGKRKGFEEAMAAKYDELLGLLSENPRLADAVIVNLPLPGQGGGGLAMAGTVAGNIGGRVSPWGLGLTTLALGWGFVGPQVINQIKDMRFSRPRVAPVDPVIQGWGVAARVLEPIPGTVMTMTDGTAPGVVRTAMELGEITVLTMGAGRMSAARRFLFGERPGDPGVNGNSPAPGFGGPVIGGVLLLVVLILLARVMIQDSNQGK